MSDFSATELLLPAEELIELHRSRYGHAPAYSSPEIGIINTLTRMVLELQKENDKLKDGE